MLKVDFGVRPVGKALLAVVLAAVVWHFAANDHDTPAQSHARAEAALPPHETRTAAKDAVVYSRPSDAGAVLSARIGAVTKGWPVTVVTAPEADPTLGVPAGWTQVAVQGARPDSPVIGWTRSENVK